MLAKLKVPLVLLVVLVAVVWLVASGVSRNDIYVSTLDQWDPVRAKRETVRVMGFVKDDSVVTHPEELVTDFVIRDEASKHALPVRFAGVTPDLFRAGTSVIATGRLQEGGVFLATELMTKCPSKYEGVETPHSTADAPDVTSGQATEKPPAPTILGT